MLDRLLILFVSVLLWSGGLHAAVNDTFTLKTVDGTSLRLTGLDNGIEIEKYRGKIVFLEFWGTHCPPCLISIPHYIDLQSKYRDKLAIVAIEVQGTPGPDLKEFAARKGMNYDVIPHAAAIDFVNYVGQRSGWQGSIPFLIILDQKGNFVTAQTGMLPQEALEGVIKELDKLYRKKSSSASSEKVGKP